MYDNGKVCHRRRVTPSPAAGAGTLPRHERMNRSNIMNSMRGGDDEEVELDDDDAGSEVEEEVLPFVAFFDFFQDLLRLVCDF